MPYRLVFVFVPLFALNVISPANGVSEIHGGAQFLDDMNITTCFQGRVITVNQETVQIPDRRRVQMEIVRHPGGAAILAVYNREK